MQPSHPQALEEKFGRQVRRYGSMCLLPAEQTVQLLDEIARMRSAGAASLDFSLEAFRIEDAGIRPALEYSYPSPEARAAHGGLLEATKAMVVEGAANGYPWYEVWIEDTETGECFDVGSRTAA